MGCIAGESSDEAGYCQVLPYMPFVIEFMRDNADWLTFVSRHWPGGKPESNSSR